MLAAAGDAETVSVASLTGSFFYGFKHINEAGSERYLVSAAGMRKYSEWQSPPITYWGPSQNGVEGQLLYKFDFPKQSTSVRLKASSPTWDFTREPGGVGKGASAIEVSTNGVSWLSLADNIATKRWGDDWVVNDVLPAEAAGSDSLWVRMRFLVEGALNSSYTDAQFGRSTSASKEHVFEVQATMAESAGKEGTGGVTPFLFDVTRAGPATAPLSLNWTVADVGAGSVDASDFPGGELPSGTVAFAAGEKRKTITVNVAADATDEADEMLVLKLSPTSGVEFVASSASAVVLNDDYDKLVSISPAESRSQEGDEGVVSIPFTVTRAGEATEFAVLQWSVVGGGPSPVDGDDFAGRSLPRGAIVFNPGESKKTIMVQVRGDKVFEADETFRLLVTGTIGRTDVEAFAIAVIANDDIDIAANNFVAISEVETARLEGNSENNPATPFVFRLTRVGMTTERATVRWTVSGIGAAPADSADFAGGVLPSGIAVFEPGESEKSLTINVCGDRVSELDERFAITLFDIVGARIASPTAEGVILQDDIALSIAADVPRQVEGNASSVPYAFTVKRLAGNAGPLTVGWRAEASGPLSANAADFVGAALPAGELTFQAGETSKAITVFVAGDTAWEFDERFAMTLVGERIQPASAWATIVNDDVGLSISRANSVKPEGNSGTTPLSFSVRRSGPLAAASTVAWAVTGSGDFPAGAADFVGGTLPTGELSFAAGEGSKTITVGIVGDTSVERDEVFTVTLSSATGGQINEATATGVILNDESALSVSPLGATQSEGNAGLRFFTFSVARAGTKIGTSTVRWSVAGIGTAAANAADFSGGKLPSGTISFADGEASKTITVSVAGDITIESDEDFAVTLSDAVGAAIHQATAIGTIKSDDTAVAIAAVNAAMAEGNKGETPFTFVVTRSGAIADATIVSWAVGTTSGATVNGGDFYGGVLPVGTVTFEKGETSRTITVNVNGDLDAEVNEAFGVKISTATAQVLSATATTTITSDDTQLSIGPASTSLSEGNAGTTSYTFTVLRAGQASAASAVDWAVAGTGSVPADAADFSNAVLPSGTVSFAAGETTKTITVLVAGDKITETDETFAVKLSAATGGFIGAASANALIRNDDTGVAISPIPQVKSEGQNGTTTFTFNVYRTGVLNAATTFGWAASGSGTNPAGAADFAGGTFPTGSVTFAAGQSSARITVNVAADRTVEANETFTVQLSGVAGAELIAGTAFGTIVNDDGVIVTPQALAFAALWMETTNSPKKPLTSAA